jgi:hypothetical protein
MKVNPSYATIQANGEVVLCRMGIEEEGNPRPSRDKALGMLVRTNGS